MKPLFSVLGFIVCCYASNSSVIAATNVVGIEPTNSVVFAEYDFRDRHFKFVASPAEIASSLPWKAEASAPPTSPQDAVIAAKKLAVTLVTDSRSFTPQRIVLERFGPTWFYLVELEPSNPVSPHIGNMQRIKIPVLMNGKVTRVIETKR